jgi:hypothetical protein
MISIYIYIEQKNEAFENSFDNNNYEARRILTTIINNLEAGKYPEYGIFKLFDINGNYTGSIKIDKGI